ncbi:hypothetical protein V7S43_003067 [Phytophthora oleae]|uniref:Uncharacterized protein n=1 Tax=Phytophthora oleae TaxID=2107226 RepID=A0ABD3G2E5_9STRA
MRSWLIFSALLANAAISMGPAPVEAVACPEICYTTELTGFAPGGTPGCTCSGSQQGARTGTGDCNCGQCYEKTQGVVFGFAINADGTCTYGTDCGTCDYSAASSASANGSTDTNSSSGAVTVTPSPVPTTSAPSPSPVAAPVVADASSSSTSLSTTGSIGASSSNSKSSDGVGDSTGSHSSSEVLDKGLSKWQIVLAISCSVLFFLVAVVSVCTCYCKARSRLYEHEDAMANYYNQQTPTVQTWTAPSAGLPIATKTNVNIV